MFQTTNQLCFVYVWKISQNVKHWNLWSLPDGVIVTNYSSNGTAIQIEHPDFATGG